MNALGKYCHDFPRLAKESGYNFQLYRGKITWNDLDEVDPQEIIEKRNFQQLEENLIHVINCNLEKEFDVSTFDQNFIKLFRLAQLGVDYLSYCELYLDRCVILLQEQLSNLQEQCLLLKEENEKKDEELKRSRLKARLQSQNYKCNKCKKVFLNETYLELHEKRRHGNLSEPNENKIYKNEAAQTEEEVKTVSEFTQTVDNEIVWSSEETGTKDFLKMSEQESKIDNLKRDLEELKIRLSLAEKTMEEKKNDEKTFQSSFPNAVIPIIHSYISPQRNGYVQLPATSAVVQSFPNQFILQEDGNESYEAVAKENKPCFNEYPRRKNSDRSDQQSVTGVNVAPEDISSRETTRILDDYKFLGNMHVNVVNKLPHSPPQRLDVPVTKQSPEVLIEELHPKTKNTGKVKNSQAQLEIEDIVNDPENTLLGPSSLFSNSDLKLESESGSENIHVKTSTPSKTSPSPKIKINESVIKNKWSSALSPTNGPSIKRKSKSEETIVRDIGLFDGEEKSKSLLQKLVTKKSPKIQELKSNLRNSFSQLYGSVSSSTKRNLDTEPKKCKTDVVEGLHSKLKELGIDPEWSGIPKETMKQKLRILEHHRNLLTKENRLYPFLRRKLEKHVLKRIQGNSLLSKKQTSQTNDELNQQKSKDSGTSGVFLGESSEITIYDSDGDSESQILDSGRDRKLISPGPSETIHNTTESSKLKNPKGKEEERETIDFSIFQASKFKEGKAKMIELEVPDEIVQKQKFPSAEDDVQTDSDFDDELFKKFQEQSIRSITKHISAETDTAKKDIIGSFPAKMDDEDEFSSFRNNKLENQSILKSEAENKLITKKKVLFADEPQIFETGVKPGTKSSAEMQKISSVADDDDDWSIESEWTINNDL